MSKRQKIAFDDFNTKIFELWAKDWLLLSAGDQSIGKYNMMTVGWGSFGVLWRKPFVMALVRPQRYTLPFMNEFDTFTLCAFPEEYRSALNFCGSKSGRDYPDKAKAAGLTVIASNMVKAPSYEEAELVIECKKTYMSVMEEKSFLDPVTAKEFYPDGDWHHIYFGEILHIEGTEKYLAK